ncbi:DUF2141 domain-containing protein [Croceicoccus sp. F390]|uniref:DUF2141 domain-containing protein n=1 Tax=Croceicoccus esteveae TaxID=3075597 RepID=A0ABU2ZJ34_9SPHN|nr:DUF2141 domain-containing protein [Croceicoccus sp. F390]MDT0575417.1 DUF2141 domain-containing protein [Croceicoccus sp. F390]
MSRVRWMLLPGAALLLAAGAPHHDADVVVNVTHMRSHDGKVVACLSSEAKIFPKCKGEHGRSLVLPADQADQIRFSDVPPGRYALALLHDENGNGKIDKAMMIPREGFGFSRDAKVSFGPPSFSDAAFDVGANGAQQSIRMRYMM